MKSDNPNIKQISVHYTGNNNFIAGTTDDRKTVAKNALKNLDATDHKVIITDPYLFKENEQSYKLDLADILKSLNAREIKLCAPQRHVNQHVFQFIQNELNSVGCNLIHDPSLTDCHDRFWYCLESEKTVIFGTSLNGLCKKICRVDNLTDDETKALKAELALRGII